MGEKKSSAVSFQHQRQLKIKNLPFYYFLKNIQTQQVLCQRSDWLPEVVLPGVRRTTERMTRDMTARMTTMAIPMPFQLRGGPSELPRS